MNRSETPLRIRKHNNKAIAVQLTNQSATHQHISAPPPLRPLCSCSDPDSLGSGCGAAAAAAWPARAETYMMGSAGPWGTVDQSETDMAGGLSWSSVCERREAADEQEGDIQTRQNVETGASQIRHHQLSGSISLEERGTAPRPAGPAVGPGARTPASAAGQSAQSLAFSGPAGPNSAHPQAG